MDDKSKKNSKSTKTPPSGGRGADIQLRSEKVRHIIGQVPPVLIRYGIMIIVLSFVLLICLASFIPYQPTFKTEIIVSQDVKSEFIYTVKIPEEIMKSRSSFRNVVIDDDLSNNALPVSFGISFISDTINMSKSGAYRIAKLLPIENRPIKMKLSKPLVLSGSIQLEKTTLLLHSLTLFYKSH